VRAGGFKIGSIKDIDLIDAQAAEPQLRIVFTLPRRLVVREDEQRKRGSIAEPQDAASFQDHNDRTIHHEKSQQRRNRAPRHRLARRGHALAEEVF